MGAAWIIGAGRSHRLCLVESPGRGRGYWNVAGPMGLPSLRASEAASPMGQQADRDPGPFCSSWPVLLQRPLLASLREGQLQRAPLAPASQSQA